MKNKEENPGTTVGEVEPQQLKLRLPAGGFALERGGLLPEIVVAYESFGKLAADRSNVVFICHALTGDAHVAGIRPGSKEPDGWWEMMIGTNRGIDPRYYHVICANILGGCAGTTGPRSINPKTGRPYGSSFPVITVRDIVAVHRLLLQQLGFEHLAAVIGGSFGGMQALEWALQAPESLERCIVIASAVQLSAQALAFDIVGRSAITQDPNWQGGDYYGPEQPKPDLGLAQARRLAHITYLSQEGMDSKFGRERRTEWVNAGPDFQAESLRNFRTTFQVESYLQHQGEKLVARFDAKSYLQITRAMDEYDLSERFGSLQTAFAETNSRFLIIALSGDWLFTPDQSEDIVSALLALGKPVSYCHLNAPAGHDAFLTHVSELAPAIRAFLPWVGEERQADKPQLSKRQATDYKHLLPLVAPAKRVLDLGCGDGSLLRLLTATDKEIESTGVEIVFDRLLDVLDGGNDALLADIDAGLAMVPDNSFDLVVLSETLQAIRQPRQLLREILRVAPRAIITFPNFGYLPLRIKLLLQGKMPKNERTACPWYDTPNVHLFTLSDFLELCHAESIAVTQIKGLASKPCGRLLLKTGLTNAGAERIIVNIARPKI